MDSARRSRNRIVLVFVIEPRHPIEDEDENDEGKFARRAKILRDSSTNIDEAGVRDLADINALAEELIAILSCSVLTLAAAG